jgi:hypothetical protein
VARLDAMPREAASAKGKKAVSNVTKPRREHRHDWLAHLVQLQLAIGDLRIQESPAAGEPTWPAHVIRAGVVLAAVSGLVLFTWLRRRL